MKKGHLQYKKTWMKNDGAVVPGNILGGCPASICDTLSLIKINRIDQGYLDTCGTDVYI